MKKFLSIGNFKTDFPDMDKKLKSKTRLRKEDISQPVDFRHVEHVGFDKDIRNGSVSACTSPTEIKDKFFRLSDSSIQSIKNLSEKENRLSSELKQYQQFQDECNNLQAQDYKEQKAKNNNYKQAGARSSFSGSLRNLNFLSFTNKEKLYGTVKKDSSKSSKRISLGSLLGGGRNSYNPTGESFDTPPISPIYETIPSGRNTFTRRRSSSFNGDSDFLRMRPSCDLYVDNGEGNATAPIINGKDTKTNNVFNFPKKPKYSRPQVSLPLSPTYDDLPPPPPDDDEKETSNPIRSSSGSISLPSPLPEFPSYDQLPPPPLQSSVYLENDSVVTTVVLRRGKGPPPTPVRYCEEENSSIRDFPPPLPLSPPPKWKPNKFPEPSQSRAETSPSNTMTTFNNKGPAWKSKLIRANAPTLPPLSVPLIRPPSNEAPQTPETWPLEPCLSDLIGFKEEISMLQAYDLPTIRNEPESTNSPGSNKVDQRHLIPLSQMFQNRISLSQWPTVMNKLFAKSDFPQEVVESPSVNKMYGELVTKTLELWMELKEGNVSIGEIVSSFDNAHKEIQAMENK